MIENMWIEVSALKCRTLQQRISIVNEQEYFPVACRLQKTSHFYVASQFNSMVLLSDSKEL